MKIGVPKEIKTHEYRVGLTPAGVRELTMHGHQVTVERNAAAGIGISDDAYRAAGATVVDSAAYGVIVTQGYGTLGGQAVSTPSMIRFGEMTEDEVFVTADVAKAGVRIENPSASDPLVMLKHFGPGNPDAKPLIKK